MSAIRKKYKKLILIPSSEEYERDFNRYHDAPTAAKSYRVALRHLRGIGTRKDKAVAFSWMLTSAKENHVYAQYRIGKMFAKGVGVQQDFSKAAVWLQKATVQNHVPATLALAKLYLQGKVSGKNAEDAFQLFESLAVLGHRKGFYRVARSYERGVGVEENMEAARLGYERASLLGDGPSFLYLYAIYRDGKGVPVDFERALSYLQKAVEIRYVGEKALCELGDIYRRNQEVPVNPIKAQFYYQKAMSEYASGEAAFFLGVLYGEYPDLSPAEERYQMIMDSYTFAANKGLVLAQRTLASCYKDKNNHLEIQWRRKAAASGDLLALHELGEALLRSVHARALKFDNEHIKYLRRAANSGLVVSMKLLGSLPIVPIDERIDWYKSAIEAGSFSALLSLGALYQNEEKDMALAAKYYRDAVSMATERDLAAKAEEATKLLLSVDYSKSVEAAFHVLVIMLGLDKKYSDKLCKLVTPKQLIFGWKKAEKNLRAQEGQHQFDALYRQEKEHIQHKILGCLPPLLKQNLELRTQNYFSMQEQNFFHRKIQMTQALKRIMPNDLMTLIFEYDSERQSEGTDKTLTKYLESLRNHLVTELKKWLQAMNVPEEKISELDEQLITALMPDLKSVKIKLEIMTSLGMIVSVGYVESIRRVFNAFPVMIENDAFISLKTLVQAIQREITVLQSYKKSSEPMTLLGDSLKTALQLSIPEWALKILVETEEKKPVRGFLS